MKTEYDLEVINLLDFDPELACEYKPRNGTCEAPAVFVLRCRECARSVLICAQHMEANWAKDNGTTTNWMCTGCQTFGQFLRDVFDVIPVHS